MILKSLVWKGAQDTEHSLEPWNAEIAQVIEGNFECASTGTDVHTHARPIESRIKFQFVQLLVYGLYLLLELTFLNL